MKKPKIKDYLCEECGVVHEWEYKEDLKKWKKTKK